MRPQICQEVIDEYFRLELEIAEHIHKTKAKSYLELKIEPKIGHRCFVCVPSGRSQPNWCRGLIEHINQNKYRVRLLDHAQKVDLKLNQIYLYKGLPEVTRLGFLAIRCCITKDTSMIFSDKAIELFEECVKQRNKKTFKLIEEIRIGRFSCWLTELTFGGQIINDLIIKFVTDSQRSSNCNQSLDNSFNRSELKAIEDQDLLVNNKEMIEERTIEPLNDQNEFEEVEEDFERKNEDEYFGMVFQKINI